MSYGSNNTPLTDKSSLFEEVSLGIFTRQNLIRKFIISIILNRYFERFILFTIALNSLFLGLSDYSNVDHHGELVQEGSWRNTLIGQSEIIFTIIFTIECIFKIIGMGFYGKGGYLKDRWNWLDFIVVITGWISLVPAIPNISIIRTFRVLRPLKSISTNPGLQSLVVAILNSIPQLVGVLILLMFVFLLFGIAGLQLFSGPEMHARCRITPYPVDLSWIPGESYESHRCLNVGNFDLPGEESWTKESSPWSTPRDCFWPLADDVRFCSFTNSGLHKCLHHAPINESEWTWCGSNYDATGNPRFKSKEIMEEATFVVDLNWGYTNFDNLGTAFITIFQCITLEGWTDIMYQVQDSINEPLASIIFVCLILFGTFFCLNLVLAVLEDNFVHTRSSSSRSGSMMRTLKKLLDKYLPDMPTNDSFLTLRKQLRYIIRSTYFSSTITTLIVLNTLVLAMTHYPEDVEFENVLDALNFLFSLLFGLEMTLKLIAYGLYEYLLVPENIFDAFIVIVSFVEVVTAPPLYFGGKPSSSGAISALRSFRLFRIFKLFSKWKSMRSLISKVIRTVMDLGNFALLLFLFLYIYTLIGMQFFANRFRFDSHGHPYRDINSYKWKHAEYWSRSNFDDFPHSFATVFQILTTENWNSVLYDCRRSIGPASMIFACSLIILGNYIFMNLFLAILIGNFASNESESSETIHDDDGMSMSKYNMSGSAESYEFNTINKTTSKNDIKQRPRSQSNSQSHSQMLTKTQSQSQLQSQRKKSLKNVKIIPNISPKNSLPTRPINEEKIDENNNNNGNNGNNNNGNINLQPTRQLTPDNNLQITNGVIITTNNQSPNLLDELQQNQIELGSGVDSNNNNNNNNNNKIKNCDEEKEKDLEKDNVLYKEIIYEKQNYNDNKNENNNDNDNNKKKMNQQKKDNNNNNTPQENNSNENEDDSEEEVININNSETFGSKSQETTSVGSQELTLGIFSSTNPIRKICNKLIHDPNFDRLILILIAISSITLAIDNPLLNPKSQLSISLDVIDILLTIFFSIEMIIKVIALGLIMHPGAYLRSYWNCLDFFVVGISFAGLFSGSRSLISLRSLRSLRGLRPLRVINRAPGLKLVVNAVLASLPDVMNVGALCFLFFLIFSIFGVNYFKGQLRGCTGSFYNEYIRDVPDYMKLLTYPKPWNHLNDIEKSYFGPNSTIPLNCNSYNFPNEPCCSDYKLTGHLTSKMICKCWGAQWDLLGSNNFDNVGMALLTLFQMSTTEGWVTLMYQLVDTSDIDMQPIRDNRVEWIFFSVFFILVAAYLALNLFVGVVIENFNKMKLKLDGNLGFLTPEQQEWIKTQDIVRRIKPSKKPIRPKEVISGIIFDISYHPWFEWFIMYSIITNTIIMAMVYFGQSHLYGRFLETMNMLFAGIFTIEALVKIIALRKKYFHDSWNQYDFIIVLGTNAGLIYRWVKGTNIGLTVTVLRTFRVARLLKLVNGTESISQLVNTLIITLPGLGNIAALLFLLFFIYAVTGVQLFAKVGYHGSYDEHANFRDFGIALLSLLRFATGESWNNFMYDASRKPEGCVVDPEYNSDYCGFNNHVGCIPLNGCGSLSIFPYMITFSIVISVVFINLFVGVILEGFSTSSDDTTGSVKPDDFMKFADHWSLYDPEATCYITIQQLEDFIQTLFPPLGFGKKIKSKKELAARISKLHLHIHPGKVVHFKDVLSALSTDAIQRVSELKGTGFELQSFVDQMWNSNHHTGQKKRLGALQELVQRKQQYTMEHFYAVKRIEKHCARLVERIKEKRALNNKLNELDYLSVSPAINQKDSKDVSVRSNNNSINNNNNSARKNYSSNSNNNNNNDNDNNDNNNNNGEENNNNDDDNNNNDNDNNDNLIGYSVNQDQDKIQDISSLDGKSQLDDTNDSLEPYISSNVHWIDGNNETEEGAISDQDIPLGNIEKYQE